MPYTGPQIQQPSGYYTPVPRYAPTQPYGNGIHSANTSPTSTYQQASHLPVRSNNSSFSCDANAPLNPFLAQYIPPRQLHPPKSPLYRPAVLRATERPSRPSTANANSASSSGSGSPREGREGGSGLSIFGSGTGEILSNVFGTTSLGSVPEWEEVFEKACTAPPNRERWKADALSTTCDSTVCAKSFSLFERRHHCRRCGNVFCSQHSSRFVRLDQDCDFHPQGFLSRTCDTCFEAYKRLVAQRRASNTSTGTNSSGDSTVPSSPVMGVGIGRGTREADNTFGGRTPASCVGSVPRDWTWSTF